jgi:gliding motility-associated-like protein
LSPTKTILLVPVILFSIGLKGQLCSGSLGNPVATIDFGAGSNPGAAISNVPVTYQYTNQDCPQEGFYAIRNSTFFCFSSDWLVVPFDHSPNDPNGYFLMVNALTGPSLIYTDTITALCPNNPVQVDAWVLNLLKPTSCSGNGINPNITFTVTDMSGNTLGQKNTGDLTEIDPVTWTSHSFLFTAPANGSVIIKITSNAAGGCGNEFAIDDITFRPCGPSISTAFVNNAATQLIICETNQQNLQMLAFYNGTYANPVFQWQMSNTLGFSWNDIPGATATTYTKPTTAIGEYWYRCVVTDASLAANTSCRFASNPLKIQIVSPPFAQATNYVYGCYGSTIYLFAAGGSYYEWWGPNGFYANVQGPAIPNVTFSATGEYIVKVTSTPGCFAYDTTTLTIYAAPVATLTPVSVSICEGDSVQFNAGGSLRYRWLPATGLSNDTIPNPFAKPMNDITYTVRVYNEYTCFDTASVNVIVWKKPKAFAGPDQYFRKGKPVQLNGNATGSNVSYSWSPPTYLDNPNYLKPKAKPPGTITYTLTVVSNNGCGVSTDDVKLEAIDKLFIPTGFTPNNDGLNDRWEIVTFEDYPGAIAEVYNRYGQLIYRGYGKDYKPWDGTFVGKPCLPGVYVYLVNLHNGKPILKGTLNLIR